LSATCTQSLEARTETQTNYNYVSVKEFTFLFYEKPYSIKDSQLNYDFF
jgi:hypothetical protein